MEPKKNRRADLEKRRAVHIQVGLILALSFVLVSLEWGTVENSTAPGFYYIPDAIQEEEMPPLVEREFKVKKPAPRLLIPIPVELNEQDPEIDFGNMFNSDITGFEIDFRSIYIQEEEPVEEVLDIVDVNIKPEFPGGDAEMMKWLYQNVKFPQECIDHGIEGRVIAKFIVNKSGRITNIEILRKVHPLLDQEVIRVLSEMPDFRPAMRAGKLVPVYMHIPVVFDLR